MARERKDEGLASVVMPTLCPRSQRCNRVAPIGLIGDFSRHPRDYGATDPPEPADAVWGRVQIPPSPPESGVFPLLEAAVSRGRASFSMARALAPSLHFETVGVPRDRYTRSRIA